MNDHEWSTAREPFETELDFCKRFLELSAYNEEEEASNSATVVAARDHLIDAARAYHHTLNHLIRAMDQYKEAVAAERLTPSSHCHSCLVNDESQDTSSTEKTAHDSINWLGTSVDIHLNQAHSTGLLQSLNMHCSCHASSSSTLSEDDFLHLTALCGLDVTANVSDGQEDEEAGEQKPAKRFDRKPSALPRRDWSK
jgi:hypothetical protein